MRIGVIGSGRVGGTLGRAWAARGHELTFGSRNPTGAKVTALAREVPGARAASLADTLTSSAVILLAVPGAEAETVASSLVDWEGKVVLDATNDLSDLNSSNAEAVQRAAPGARVVKAFNVVGVEAMTRAAQEAAGSTMPLAGNDEGAVSVAAQLARDAGFTPLRVGGLAQAASLERLASVWIDWSRTLGRSFLWQVLR